MVRTELEFRKELIVQSKKELENHPMLQHDYRNGITARAVMKTVEIIQNRKQEV